MADTFPEKANSPKNCPCLSGGESSTIYVLEVTHIAPKLTPNKLPAIQKDSLEKASTPIASAMHITMPTYKTAFLAPLLLVI